MLRDIKFVIRKSANSKFFTVINVFGLTIGLTVILILSFFIHQETTYDHYHKNADNIYKVISQFTNNHGKTSSYGISMGIIAEDYLEKFPEVEQTARLYYTGSSEVDLEDKRFDGVSILYADFSFVDIFDFGGPAKGSFSIEQHALVSREFAGKIGTETAIGTSLTVDDESYIINNIIDLPKETTFQFDLLLPITSFEDFHSWKHGGLEFETYVVLKGGNREETLVKLAEHYNQVIESKWDGYTCSNYLIPLKDVYLHPVHNRMGNGNKAMLFVVGSVAVLILLLALINYLNLHVANSHSRKGEIRIRKVMGASTRYLFKLAIVESLLFTFAAGMMALVLLEVFNNMEARQIFNTDLPSIGNWPIVVWAVYIVFLIILGGIGGVFPALHLLRIKAFSNQDFKISRLGSSTIGLVIFQFFISATLLTAIIFINLQIDHLRNQSMGFNTENIVLIKNLNSNHKEAYDFIKSELLSQPGIIQLTGTQAEPGAGASGQVIFRAVQSVDERINVAHIRSYDGYLETFDLDLLMGEGFRYPLNENIHQFVLNEMAYSRLYPNGENPIGDQLIMGNRKGPVVGVVKDFHFRSFHHEIAPLVLNIEDPYYLTLAIRLENNNIDVSLDKIGSVLSQVDPLYTLNYQFMDDKFDMMYRSELKIKKIITYSTIIAFSISILGLLAMSIFVINAKTKEIAIRKTLGARHLDLLWQLSYRLLIWITVGNILAVPVTFYFVKNWSENFIYQVGAASLFWIIPVAVVTTIVIAGAVIFNKLWQAMNLNPVVYLRNE